MAKFPKELQSRFASAMTNSRMWKGFLSDAYKYILPNRNYWENEGPQLREKVSEAQRKNIDVYDITAVLAARGFISKIHSTLTPPFQQWASYTAGSLVEGAKIDSINQELQVETKKLFKAIQDSNFDLAINECYADLVMGTGALLIEEGDDDDPLIFKCIPIIQLGFEEDSKGIIQTTFREMNNLTLDNIKGMWPKAEISSQILNASKNDATKTYSIIDAIIYNEKDKNYEYYVIWKDNNEIMFQESTDSQKLIIFRWNKLPGEVFGRGIAHDALPTIQTLNGLIELMWEASEIGAFPPMLGFSDDIFNPANLELSPKTIIAVSRPPMANQPPLMKVPFEPNLELAQLDLNDLRGWISKAFFAEPLGPVTAPTKTATEVAVRQQAFLEEIGTAFGRLETEFLSRIVERCTFILHKKGLIGDIKVDGKNVALKYQSPLARLQAQQDLQNFSLASQVLQGLYGELSLAVFDLTKIPKFVAEKTGSELDLFKSESELQQLKEEIRQKLMGQVGGDQQQGQPGQQGQGASPDVPTAPLGSQQEILPFQPQQ